MNQPIMNKMLLRKNKEIKKAWKSAKKHYVRRDRGGLKLKGVLLKVVQTFPGQEEPVNMVSDSNQAAGIASVTKENLIEAVKAVQLNGMSGNGFPVAQKLEAFANAGSKHKILLINAVECDPGLLHDEWLVHSHLEEINQGILAIREAFGIERSILALKAVRNVSEESNGITLTAEVEICPVAARYPAGEEHFLIHSALGIELSESELPTNQGILVMNVQTVWQIGRIVKGTFDGGRYISAADVQNGIAKPVYVGHDTKITEVLQKAFGVKSAQEYKCYAGGGIMAAHEADFQETCTDQISFIAYIPVGFTEVLSNQNRCKGCGACSHKCPAGIDVRQIVSLLEQDPNADIRMYHPENCLHCGSCTWYCHGNKTPELYFRQDI